MLPIVLYGCETWSDEDSNFEYTREIAYKQILINANLEIGKRGQKTS